MTVVEPIFKPNPTAMRQHLEHLFGGHGDGFLELAWTTDKPDASGRYPLGFAEWFRTTEIDALVERAVGLNSRPMVNVYIGAGLRKPDSMPAGRSHDSDAWKLTCAYVDLDDEGGVPAARELWAFMKPTFIVGTGREPHLRAQAYWKLTEPISDHGAWTAILKAIARRLGGDSTVTNPGRVLRLAGTVAWPQKPGRTTELTFIGQTTGEPRPRPSYDVKTLATYFQYDPAKDAAHAPMQAEERPVERKTNSLGLADKITDGRELYMRNTLIAVFIEFVGENGAEPTPEELVEAAWPQYAEKVDLTKPGRNRDEMHRKAVYLLRRFNEGALRGLTTLEEVIDTYRGRRQRQAVEYAAADFGGDDAPQGDKPRPSISATPFDLPADRDIPRREWLYGRHLIRRFTSTTVAPGGVGKSQLLITDGLAMATGRTLLRDAPADRLRVWYWNGEDPMDEITRRIAATAKHYGISADDLSGFLFVDSGRDTEIKIAVQGREGTRISVPVVDAVVATIRENQIDAVIIDPFVSSHGVTENDNMAIDAVVKTWGKIAHATGCAIELVHHVRKTNGNEVTVEDGRGAVALLAAVRSARALNQMTDDQGAKYGIAECRRFFRVTVGKSNLYVPDDASSWHELVSVDLANGAMGMPGDSVGVVTAWDTPDPLANVTAGDVEACRQALIRNPGRNRHHRLADGWFGHLVCETLGMDSDNKSDCYKAERLIAVWVENGAFRIAEEKKRSGRPIKVVEVA